MRVRGACSYTRIRARKSHAAVRYRRPEPQRDSARFTRNMGASRAASRERHPVPPARRMRVGQGAQEGAQINSSCTSSTWNDRATEREGSREPSHCADAPGHPKNGLAVRTSRGNAPSGPIDHLGSRFPVKHRYCEEPTLVRITCQVCATPLRCSVSRQARVPTAGDAARCT